MKEERRSARASGERRAVSRRLPSGSRAAVTTRFGVIFLLLIGGFVLLDLSWVPDTLLHQPLARVIAQVSAIALDVIGEAKATGTLLQFNGFVVLIADACDGLLPIMIYVCAVLAFPARWKEKGWGMLLGLPSVFAINLARVITLMMIGAYWRTAFDQVHMYVWQAFVSALALVIWVLWAEFCLRQNEARKAHERVAMQQ